MTQLDERGATPGRHARAPMVQSDPWTFGPPARTVTVATAPPAGRPAPVRGGSHRAADDRRPAQPSTDHPSGPFPVWGGPAPVLPTGHPSGPFPLPHPSGPIPAAAGPVAPARHRGPVLPGPRAAEPDPVTDVTAVTTLASSARHTARPQAARPIVTPVVATPSDTTGAVPAVTGAAPARPAVAGRSAPDDLVALATTTVIPTAHKVAAPAPVFVDGSGRRARWFKGAAVAAAALCASYISVVAAGALSGPTGPVGGNAALAPTAPSPQAQAFAFPAPAPAPQVDARTVSEVLPKTTTPKKKATTTTKPKPTTAKKVAPKPVAPVAPAKPVVPAAPVQRAPAAPVPPPKAPTTPKQDTPTSDTTPKPAGDATKQSQTPQLNA